MHLLDFPAELLATICGHSDWDDVLRLRQTCKFLKKVSYHRETWTAILSSLRPREVRQNPGIALASVCTHNLDSGYDRASSDRQQAVFSSQGGNE
ncbi:hypothetical protein FA13DRAFT_828056 [Coprinellus micaceus]|uniref:F-box domain-containing protein n=1 Tax=Coprinellus micaceus TaxID=71717 RepID=A0A4Y7T1M3_COPMI|nr:hypothetical protein FA13DRAFT_828056 [Coprinellus micaceus]